MLADGQHTKWRGNIAKNFNRLSRLHKCYRQRDDGWRTDDDIVNVNASSGSLEMHKICQAIQIIVGVAFWMYGMPTNWPSWLFKKLEFHDLTRLPSNLRICDLVTGGYFRSRSKDGGHTIQSTVVENPMLHAHFTVLCYRCQVIGDGILTPHGSRFVLTCRHPLRVDLLWSWPADLHIQTWHILPGDTPDVQM